MGRKSISHIRKPEILRHTYKVVEEEGFMGMTIGKVAARMGVNSGLLIHYFKSKEGLIMEMVDYLYESSMTIYLEELTKYTTPQKRLEGLLDMVFDTSGTMPQRDAVFWSCYAMGFRNDQIREKIKGLMKKFIDFGISEIEAWEESGIVNVADKERAAAIILALSEGFGILRNSVDDMTALREISQFMKKTALNTLGIHDTP
ncbi:MAG: TetR/AcrR family transcriptional regulator [Desulfobacteraceae bacterium]|nr:TetR/AcrR family transcriptional regulator [Desulfobacteraceae bacterium]